MKLAMVFPGQGSQSVGMLRTHADPVIDETLTEASDILSWDMRNLVQNGPEDQLNQTRFTQPSLLAASVALWRIWQREELPAPAVMAGHSLGEFSALVAAGSLDFADALRLVAERGRLMEAHAPAGAGLIAVIGLDDEAVEALCESCPVDGLLSPVNYNAPGQVVVAGEEATLAWLSDNAKAHGARMATRLPVSVPSHCAMMRKAADELAGALDGTVFHAPTVPVLHNLDAAPRDGAEAIRQALRRQLCEPVLWTRTQASFVDRGVTRIVECGPGRVLCGLAKRALKGMPSTSLETPEGFDQIRTWLTEEV
jgi:[acyl-carrier-protein] S-malonyltransferase